MAFFIFMGAWSYAQTKPTEPLKNEKVTDRFGLVQPDSIEMVFVHGGTFRMGSDRNESEKPVHPVTVSSFYMSTHEITQEQWQAVMGYNESWYSDCPVCPVEMVSWNRVQEFITKLSKLTAKHYRLPTEAEWEFAATGWN